MSLKSVLLVFIAVLLFVPESYVDCLQNENIIGDLKATKGQFKHFVIVFRNDVHACGGVIIDDYNVLTAAHCVVDWQNNKFRREHFRVVGGITNVDDESPDKIEVNVKKIFIHKSFQLTIQDDIAVLELEKSLNLKTNTHLAKLDLPKDDVDYAGKTGKIAGFGLNWLTTITDMDTGDTKENGGNYDDDLRYLEAKILSNEACKKKNILARITPEVLCAQADQTPGEQAVCTGDSGGPLVVDNTVVGILSTSPIGCDETMEAAMYTRVSKYRDFIANTINGITISGLRILEIMYVRGQIIFMEKSSDD